MKRKLLFIFTALLTTMTMSAIDPVNGNCGATGHESDVTWTLSDEDGDGIRETLTISKVGETGAMANYNNANSTPWYSYRSDIATIVIGDGVTNIGNFAFYAYNSALTSVSIPATVTTIGQQVFQSCTQLNTVTFAGGSQLTSIAQSAFAYCSGLKSITLPSSVTSIGHSAFIYCNGMETLTLNSNPQFGQNVFNNVPEGAVKMNLSANGPVDGAYWTTFYNYYSSYYNFQITDAGSQNTQIFKATLSDDAKLTLFELGDDPEKDKIITGGNAVILKSTSSPIVLTLTTTNSSNDFSGNSLKGVGSASGVTANGTHFVLNNGSQGIGFYRMTSGKKIGVGKAYLNYSSTGAREFFAFEEESTGIASVNVNLNDNDNRYYDLQGRRIAQPTKGLYIVNGKMVFIK